LLLALCLAYLGVALFLSEMLGSAFDGKTTPSVPDWAEALAFEIAGLGLLALRHFIIRRKRWARQVVLGLLGLFMVGIIVFIIAAVVETKLKSAADFIPLSLLFGLFVGTIGFALFLLNKPVIDEFATDGSTQIQMEASGTGSGRWFPTRGWIAAILVVVSSFFVALAGDVKYTLVYPYILSFILTAPIALAYAFLAWRFAPDRRTTHAAVVGSALVTLFLVYMCATNFNPLLSPTRIATDARFGQQVNRCRCNVSDWRRLSVPELGFVASIPRPLTETWKTNDTKFGKRVVASFSSDFERKAGFAVSCIIFPAEMELKSPDAFHEDFQKDVLKEGVRRLLRNSPISLRGCTGQEFRYEDARTQTVVTMKTFLVGKRFYEVVCSMPKTEFCEEHLRQFMDSFDFAVSAEGIARPDETLPTR
jgi:hypothetical protein